MELCPRIELKVPPSHTARDVQCVCFHPRLPSCYLGFSGAVVEFDMVTGAELGTMPVRLPPTKLLFLSERSALCVCLDDGSVVVISARDGHVLTEHRPKSSDHARPFKCADLYVDEGGFCFLFAARMRSHSVMALNLFTQNKKIPVFSGHKSYVTCLACHPSLALMACAAMDGTVRVYETTTLSLYNLIEAEKDKEGPKAYVRLQFDEKGRCVQAVDAMKKKRKKDRVAPRIFKDIRLLLVTERSLITFYDVSMPGAPNKVSDYYATGSYFRDAHFSTLSPGVVLTLDHRGRYQALCATPLGDDEPRAPLPPSKGKLKLPNAHAFKLLHDYDNIRPMTLRVHGNSRHGSAAQQHSALPSNDDEGAWQRCTQPLLCAHMHPSLPYVMFTGKDLVFNAGGGSLTVHEFDMPRSGGRGSVLPLVSPVRLPTQPDYWYDTSAEAPLRVPGRVFSASLRDYSTITVHGHEITSGEPKASVVHRLTGLKLPDGRPLKQCVPQSILHSGQRQSIVLTLLHTEGVWRQYPPQPLPYWLCIPEAGEAQLMCRSGTALCFCGEDDAELLVTKAGMLERYRVVGPGKIAQQDTANFAARGLSVTFAASLAPVAPAGLLLQVGEQSGRSSLQAFPGWEAAQSGSRSGAVELDPEERVKETAVRSDCGTLLIAVATTRRVIVCGSTLNVLATWVPPEGRPRLHSLAWIGRALSFVHHESIRVLTPTDNQRIASVPPLTAVTGVLRDRFLLCSMEGAHFDARMCPHMWGKQASHFEVLCLGALSIPDAAQRRALLHRVTPLYDCSKANAATMRKLCRAGLGDLASRLVAEVGHGQSRSLLLSCLAAATQRDRPPGWLPQCRLQMLGGDCANALLTIRDALQRQRDAVAKLWPAGVDAVAAEPEFLAALTALFRAAVAQQETAVATQVVTLAGNPEPLLASLRREGDAAAMRALATATSAHTDMEAVHLEASELANTMPQVQSQPVPGCPKGAKWRVARSVDVQTVLIIADGEERPLPPLPQQLRSYMWRPRSDAGLTGASTSIRMHPDTADAARKAAADFGDRDESGSDVPQDFGVPDAFSEDGGDDEPPESGFTSTDGQPVSAEGGEGGEGGVGKEQEELRRQYLASYAGYGDEDDHAAGDEDEGFGTRKKFRGFRIRTDVVTQEPVSLVGVTLGLKPIPTAAGGGRRGRRAQQDKPDEAPAAGEEQTGSPSAAEEPPPAFLGTSAQECLANGIKKLEKARYDDAESRMDAALVYLRSDADQLAQKSPLVQVVHYKIALRLLSKVKSIERDKCDSDGPELAHLTLLLTHIPLPRSHLITCFKKAIKWSMEVGNYGVAKGCVDRIAEMDGEVDEDLGEQRDTCIDRGETNQKVLDPRAAEPTVVFCWNTYTVLAGSSDDADVQCVRCSYCPAVFSMEAVSAGLCPFCRYGQLDC
eukprot:TRINITY_DN4779_c0_g3_i1.p1 TRINITY_DN4779_c0_g3~~TRINITY_DN4779_c0_g3_i1.p1  ORF type:complete len:1420 (+),score=457.81 TRINITY_DN4779_c0_g3_i1:84-4343(+)